MGGSERYRNKKIVFVLVCCVLSACATTDNIEGKNDIYAISYKADTAYEKSDWTVAATNYTKLTRLVPDDARAYFRLGNVFLKQGIADSAVSAYEAAILRDPNKAKYYNNLAVARIMQAKQALKAAISKSRQTDVFTSDAKIMLIRLNNINKHNRGSKGKTK